MFFKLWTSDVEQITDNTSKLIKSTKAQIDALKDHIKNHKESMNASDLKIEENSIDTAVRKFADAVAKYNATQVEYDKNVKARVKGVLKTVLDKPDEEIDQVIESGQSIEAIRGAMMGNVNTTIKTNVRQVEETYMSVLNIQRSMVQLNQMFMDLAYMVNEQGESIDRIEMNISNAQARVNEANKHLEDSIKEAKKNRKRRCCVLIIVIICAIILVSLIPFICCVCEETQSFVY
ncbi:epimorphin family [Blastocystis sp. subtype 4]|uniref:epimorphin family n=1 Tax=Blastocystis sp. subtype 4 TaxID=944170 RepID=UPI000712096F|nr:epimorphin family [Blastocystis sp. subtype 4]KNB42403.1 epimorphin family [Blastocystis sp. subtype 4]|eukprot:XP_014525852.1 epimorphin family [Blastocystis sp. subtype 4]